MKKGFTIIELILVISIVSILAVLFSSVGSAYVIRNSTQNTLNELVGSLRVAQLNSQLSKANSSWGVRVENNQIILFMGTSFGTRDASFDERFNIPGSIAVTQPSEVVFEKLTGGSTNATISVSNDIGQSSTVVVNELGSVDVN